MSLERALDRNDHAERSASRQPRGVQRVPRSPGLRKHQRTRSRRKLIAWLFMLPLVVFNVVVILGPSLATAYYAFTDWTGQGPANWVGLANFQQLFVDNEFHQALLHNIIWMALFLTIPMAVGLLIAVILSQITRFQLFFRSLFFIPYVMATVVNAAIWQNLLNPSVGISTGLDQIGIHWLDNVYFLGNEHLALPTVAFVDMWHFTGFLVVLFLAAIQAVDPELYSAARVDGANRLRQFWHITLPGIRPTLMFLTLMTTIWSFFTFEYVYILTGGGPAGSTDVLSTLLFRNALNNNLAGYATAQALVMALGGAVVAFGVAILRKRGWEV